MEINLDVNSNNNNDNNNKDDTIYHVIVKFGKTM